MKKYLLPILILTFFTGCGQKKSSTGGIATTKGQSYDMGKAIEVAKGSSNIRSLLVSHKGKMIVEEYFESYSSDSLDHMRSVTKSVMATLIGIAIDKQMIKSENESIATYLGDAAKGYESITIKHLMTMTSGLQWNEEIGYNDNDEMKAAKSQLEYVLSKPLIHDPGTQWYYNTGGTHLLSIILTKATGMSTLKFANKYLFDPLGIKGIRWKKFSGGYYGGGSGLELKPRDMIKFGMLYKDGGMFEGKRVVSEKFVEKAIEYQQPPTESFGDKSGYGYCFWINKETNAEGFAGQGYGGQTILVMPRYDIVITTTYKWRVNGHKAGKQQNEAFSVVSYAVLKQLLGDIVPSK